MEYTIVAYVIGLLLILGYAALLCIESRSLSRRQRRIQPRSGDSF